MPCGRCFAVHHEREETADDKEYTDPILNDVEIINEMRFWQDTVMCYRNEDGQYISYCIKAIAGFLNMSVLHILYDAYRFVALDMPIASDNRYKDNIKTTRNTNCAW